MTSNMHGSNNVKYSDLCANWRVKQRKRDE